MGKLIQLPQKGQPEDRQARVLQMRSDLIDLAEHRRRLKAIQDELARVKRRMLRVIDNGSGITQAKD